MKPGNVSRKRSAGTTACSSGSVATDITAGITGCGSEGLSVRATSLEGVSATNSEEGFGCTATGSSEGGGLGRFFGRMR